MHVVLTSRHAVSDAFGSDAKKSVHGQVCFLLLSVSVGDGIISVLDSWSIAKGYSLLFVGVKRSNLFHTAQSDGV